MAKLKSVYTCNDCGHSMAAWAGKCPACQKWGSIHEESLISERAQSRSLSSAQGKTFPLTDSTAESEQRFSTGSEEFNKVLGGGLVKGSAVLIGGEPGIGKSTLTMQLCSAFAKNNQQVLYVSGEESIRQLKMRGKRLNAISDNIQVLCETSLSIIKQTVQSLKPELLIVDSIQMVFKEEINSAPGTVSQVRESSSELIFLCKSLDIPLIIIGHLTKSGEIAGPRVLEHLVDTVLYFEGERFQAFRILRAFKNRFGSTNEIAVFEMKHEGLIDISNPSQIFLSDERKSKSGAIVVPCMEGSRPILVELQALTIQATFGTPLRKASGLDANRLSVILAVLEKHLQVALRGEDIFINAVGGINIKEPAIDAGIAAAILSSFLKRDISADTAIFGEIGLDGKIKNTVNPTLRIQEASKMGFKRILTPRIKDLDYKGKIEIVTIDSLPHLAEILFF